MFLFVISASFGIFGLIYLWFKISYRFFEKRGIAGPPPTFPYGNTPNKFFRRRNVVYDWDDIYQQYKGKESVVGEFEMKSPKFVLLDPKLIKSVLVKNFKNFYDSEFTKMTDKESDPILGRNPFMLRGDEWKEKRGEITPAFTPKRIKAMFPIVKEVLHKLEKYIDDNKSEPLEAREICAKYAADAVSSCIFNADAHSFTKEKPEIREMSRKLFQFTPYHLFFFTIFAIFPYLQKFHKMKFIGEDVENFFTDLMAQAILQRKKDKIDRKDYLAFLINLEEKKKLTVLDMAAHGVTFFIEGFETSSITIAHALYELANDQRVQEKLRNDLAHIFDSNGKIDYEKMLANKYFDQVFHETLRLHPPGIIINRDCNESVDLIDSSGKKISFLKDDTITILLHSIHRDAEYYPEPEKFNPERFNAENGGVKAFRDRGVFFPFGDGPRICLGMRFAIMQTKAAIATVVKNFKMTVNKKTHLPLEIEPTTFMLNIKKGGLWLNFEKI